MRKEKKPAGLLVRGKMEQPVAVCDGRCIAVWRVEQRCIVQPAIKSSVRCTAAAPNARDGCASAARPAGEAKRLAQRSKPGPPRRACRRPRPRRKPEPPGWPRRSRLPPRPRPCRFLPVPPRGPLRRPLPPRLLPPHGRRRRRRHPLLPSRPKLRPAAAGWAQAGKHPAAFKFRRAAGARAPRPRPAGEQVGARQQKLQRLPTGVHRRWNRLPWATRPAVGVRPALPAAAAGAALLRLPRRAPRPVV